MKATGIVRRIDDLGRVVIPKEIRRTMRIREGDPLEIYTNSEGEVIFRKYSALSEMNENAAHVEELMESRGQFFCPEGATNIFFPAEGCDRTAIAALPVINAGDVSGAVVFLTGEKASAATDLHKSLIQAAAQFLARQIEG